MSGNPAVVMRLVASAYAVAEKVGVIIRRDLGQSTLADRLVQQSMCSSLSKSFPKITIIGEEDLPEEAVKDLIESSQSEEILQLVVWVDPLDGTKEYTEGKLTTITHYRLPTHTLDYYQVFQCHSSLTLPLRPVHCPL
uniref:Uncharacterized protein n=1 Tax=Oncorhynchus kisutch TaxID=8019 RepID=A0A8C7INN1_ONCKI